MPATLVAIAEAVKDALNTTGFSLAFTATRVYVPVHRQEDLATLTVSVVPTGLSIAPLDRAGTGMIDYTIDVGIQQRIGPTALTPAEIAAACDPLMALAEEIADHFRTTALASIGVARAVAVAHAPVFAPAHLDEHRVFTTVLSLTYRKGRH